MLCYSSIDDERRETAALALARHAGGALARLRDAIQSPDADSRWWAARALAALGGARAVSLLIETLSDSAPDVRACAALGLAAAALTRLLADESAYVGRIAGNALIQTGPPPVPALLAALKSESAVARAGAARALVPLESHAAIPALFAALDDGSALVTYYAKEALERMGVGMVLVKPV